MNWIAGGIYPWIYYFLLINPSVIFTDIPGSLNLISGQIQYRETLDEIRTTLYCFSHESFWLPEKKKRSLNASAYTQLLCKVLI